MQVRVAELVALLSLGTDLGLGQPMEHMIRTCVIALRFADRLNWPESERHILYNTTTGSGLVRVSCQMQGGILVASIRK